MSQAIENGVGVPVRIPTVLRKFTENQAEIVAHGASVFDAIRDLSIRYGALEPHLFDTSGALRSFVNVYVNDEDVRYLDGYDTALKEGDRLAIIPAVAGG